MCCAPSPQASSCSAGACGSQSLAAHVCWLLATHCVTGATLVHAVLADSVLPALLFCTVLHRTPSAGALGLQPQDFPLLTLRGYIVFWGCAFTLTTLAIALWKQETDHYTEEQERKRRKHMHKKRHKRVGAGGGSAGRASELEDGRGSGAAAAAAARDEEPSGPDWVSRRAEIVTAYQKLWQVVSSDGRMLSILRQLCGGKIGCCCRMSCTMAWGVGRERDRERTAEQETCYVGTTLATWWLLVGHTQRYNPNS